MTPLAAELRARIAAAGPMTVAEFMADCLLHPVHGYYSTRDPFGAGGDFITAPEISQMFGELIGLALGQAWLDLGAPVPVTLAELGPGRGTLMADALRALKRVPGFLAAARVVLVEASPALRAVQAARLAGHPLRWAGSVEALLAEGPEEAGPLLLVANEFFDALPIRQFLRGSRGWRERMVTAGPDGGLAFALGPEGAVAALAHRLADTAPGEIVEIRPAGEAIAAAIGRRIAAAGGVALIIDYGGWRSRGDTLQAVRGHAFADPLACPGEADLTAHVDFEALARAARAEGAAVAGPVPQGLFLERLGIAQRAEVLARGLQGAALERHLAAHRRLTHPDEMGSLFRVLAIHGPGSPPPPGLEEDRR